MKKLTTIFLLFSVFVSGLFANPKIPKNSIGNFDNEPYYFTSNDCLNNLSINCFISKTKFRTELHFINYSLVNNSIISIQIYFESEKALDDFIKDIDLSNLDAEFKRIRQTLINADIKADFIQTDADKSVTREINPEKPYKTVYKAYCSEKQKLTNDY